MNKKRLIFIIAIGLLVVGNVYLALHYRSSSKELSAVKKENESFRKNEKVISFTRLFVGMVLKGGKEIGFEDRLKLENSVREIKDDEILNSWRKFTESKTETSAQEEAKNLLEILTNKI